MTDPVKIFFMSPLRGGTKSIEGWGNSPDTEIVAHLECTWSDCESTFWNLSHRRSGLNLRIGNFESREEALRVAAEIEDFPEWKQITVERLEDGVVWNGVDHRALQDKMHERHSAYCERLRDALATKATESAP